MFNELMALVHDRSSEKRTVLFHMISDLFTEDAEVHNNRELVLFGDVLGRLLDQVSEDDRVVFSTKVSRIDQTPRELVLKLADDEARVAAPVLEHSSQLTEADLIDFATRKSNTHRVAIARRSDLGEAITDVLVDKGDGEVLTVVTANKGARFSHRSFDILAGRASTSQRLGVLLAERSDLPASVAENLLKVLGPAVRAKLEQMMNKDEEKVGRMVVDANREVTEARGSLKRNRVEAVAMAEAIRMGRRRVDTVLDSLMEQKRMLDVAFILADLAGVPEAHVNAVLFKVDSQPIAVLARVAGLSAQCYRHLTRLRCDRLALGASQEEHMMSVFLELDEDEADKALDFHRKRRAAGAQQKAG